MPPVAMPGFPPAQIQIWSSLEGDAITVPAPFNITTAAYRLANVAAQFTRSDSTSPVATPASRDASPGWGVKIHGISGGTVTAFSAIKFNASASQIRGSPAATAYCRHCCAHSSRPNPGPMTTTLLPSQSAGNAAVSSRPVTMSSGCRTSAAVTCSERVASDTKPAPDRRAAPAANSAAPPMPRLPPITST